MERRRATQRSEEAAAELTRVKAEAAMARRRVGPGRYRRPRHRNTL